MNNLFKKAIAEFIGTFVLVFCACGVAAITNGNLLETAIAFGLSITVMAYTIGRVSGCHINPAVSLACLVDKRMTVKEFFVYIAAQLLGGIIGAIALFGFIRLAECDPAGNACNYVIGNSFDGMTLQNAMGSILVEIALTLIFVFVVLTVTDGDQNVGSKAGLFVGFALMLVHLVGIKLTGTSVNPARSIATAVSDAIFNGKLEALSQVWIFIIAPLVGGALAALLYRLFFKRK